MNYYKEILSLIAIALTFIAFLPYIHSIRSGQVKPHVFSWVIWGLTTIVVFLAQLQDQGGVGALPIGASGVITMYIAFIAYLNRANNTHYERTDWLFFTAAILSLPLWYITSDPLWAVILLTTVEVFGFVPTVRKAYHYPFEESVPFFILFIVRNLIAIIALENYSLTTILFPAVGALSCLLLIFIIVHRRKMLGSV